MKKLRKQKGLLTNEIFRPSGCVHRKEACMMFFHEQFEN